MVSESADVNIIRLISERITEDIQALCPSIFCTSRKISLDLDIFLEKRVARGSGLHL